MKKSKIIFVIISIIFFLIMIFFVYDFARRTTFPGHRNEPHAVKTTTDTGDTVSGIKK